MINPKISRATLGRAPAYLKFLRGIEDSTANISATTIAKELELGEVQVRKDLRALCGSGKPKTGYKVGELTASLASCLSEKDGGTVIIGAGKLGRALLDYAGFADYGLNILALFDNDSLKVGMTINSKEVFHISKLPNLVKRLNVDIAILTVPKEVSQECADFLVNSGIKYIWNFTPRVLKVSKDVRVWNENLIGNFVQFIAEDEEANDN